MIKVKKIENADVQQEIEEKAPEKENGLTIEWGFKKHASSINRELKKIIRKSNFTLFIAVLFLIVSATLEMLMMFRVKDVTDLAFAGDVDAVRNQIFSISILLVLLIPTLILNSKLLAVYMEKSMINIKSFFLKQAFKSNESYVKRDKITKYISTMTNNMSIVQNKYFGSRYKILSGLIHVITGIILAVALDWKILIFSGGIALIILIGVLGMSSTITKILDKLSNTYEVYTEKLREVLSGMHIIKTNALEKRVVNEFLEDSKRIQDEQAAFQKVQLNINAFIQLVVSLFLFGFLVFTLRFVWNGTYTPGEIVYVITSFSFVLLPGLGLFMNSPELKAGKEALKKMEETFKNDSSEEAIENYKPDHSNMTLRNVSFAYDEESIIDNLNLDLELGKKYLIVGPSGVGKSTFIKLLQKQIKPTSGDILFGDQNINNISQASLLKHIAYMSQDVFLFEDSIKNNITLYKDYTNDDINYAINQSNLTSFILKQHAGINQVIYDDGKNVSGGEKARIALARMIIRKASILFLDEPFANLDSKTGSSIEERMLGLNDVTLFNISHVVFEENLDQYDFLLVFSKDGVKKIKPSDYMKSKQVVLNKMIE